MHSTYWSLRLQNMRVVAATVVQSPRRITIENFSILAAERANRGAAHVIGGH
jgi:hypothetical protein